MPKIENAHMKWDAFISHASEDKESVARPLAKLLKKAGLSVWLDEHELQIGDSFHRQLSAGLSKCRYGIVIISESFLNKSWPQLELDGLIARESGGNKVVLPVWHGVDRLLVERFSPILAGRLASDTKNGMATVASEIVRVFKHGDAEVKRLSPKDLRIALGSSRDVVAELKSFDSAFAEASLLSKYNAMLASPHAFFNSSFPIFVRDLKEGRFRKLVPLSSEGPIIGDLRCEAFSSFTSVCGDRCFDINDFRQSAVAPYEFDLRRLAVSLVLFFSQHSHSLGTAIGVIERTTSAYLEYVARYSSQTSRNGFVEQPRSGQEVESPHPLQEEMPQLSNVASITPYINCAHLQGSRYRLNDSEITMSPAPDATKALGVAWTKYKASCLTPPNEEPGNFVLHDCKYLQYGSGSLGRGRYLLLVSVNQIESCATESLRLVEFTEIVDAPLDTRAAKNRAKHVFNATRAGQLSSVRYLGYATLGRTGYLGKEFSMGGALQTAEAFARRADELGRIVGRVHLLSSLSDVGPRHLPLLLKGLESRFVRRIVSFGVAYADQVLDDYEDARSRASELIHR